MRSLIVTRLLAAALLPAAAHADGKAPAMLAAPRPPEVAEIVPGTSLRAEVALRLGEPISSGTDGRQVFTAPASLEGARRLLVDYFADDRRVAAVEVELIRPLEPAALAERRSGNDEAGLAQLLAAAAAPIGRVDQVLALVESARSRARFDKLIGAV